MLAKHLHTKGCLSPCRFKHESSVAFVDDVDVSLPCSDFDPSDRTDPNRTEPNRNLWSRSTGHTNAITYVERRVSGGHHHRELDTHVIHGSQRRSLLNLVCEECWAQKFVSIGLPKVLPTTFGGSRSRTMVKFTTGQLSAIDSDEHVIPSPLKRHHAQSGRWRTPL